MEVYPKLLKYAIARGNDKDTAHDLVMKSFMKALEKFNKTQELPEQLLFYLIRTIRNTMVEEFRQSEVRKKNPYKFTSFDDLGDYLNSVDQTASDPFMKKRIARAFGQLSDNCREILALVALDYTYNDITEITDRNRNSVAGAIFKCRDKFRIYLYGENRREY